MRKEPADEIRLLHMSEAIAAIETYTSGTSFAEFEANSMMKAACQKQLETVGEAANRLTAELKQNYPDVEWRKIVGLRNMLIHEYFGLDDELIWTIIKTDIPKFKAAITKILTTL